MDKINLTVLHITVW